MHTTIPMQQHLSISKYPMSKTKNIIILSPFEQTEASLFCLQQITFPQINHPVRKHNTTNLTAITNKLSFLFFFKKWNQIMRRMKSTRQLPIVTANQGLIGASHYSPLLAMTKPAMQSIIITAYTISPIKLSTCFLQVYSLLIISCYAISERLKGYPS